VNFFAEQDKARSNTKLLVLLFGVAVLLLVGLTNLLLVVAASVLQRPQKQPLLESVDLSNIQALPWPVMALVSLLVLVAIGIAIAVKQFQLSQGGQAVALSLGGQRLDRQLADRDQQQLLNIVEEMAIASGVAVPPVYLLPEAGINAFAAGYSPADAVVGITQGALNQLNREQLQGVIAHEFSHILNGDMRLNIRLIALLHGIEFIGLTGYFLLRMTGRGRRSNSKDNSVAVVLGVGLGLTVLGYLGLFFGSLIKAAVSRQREFLADASAVQFTRNPLGIAGALRQIQALQQHGRVQHPNANEVSHLFFAEALSRFGSLLATHPPLAERIRRLDRSGQTTDAAAATQKPTAASTQPQSTSAIQPQLLVLPALLLEQSRQSAKAPALVFACLMQPAYLPQQMQLLRDSSWADWADASLQFVTQLSTVAPAARLQLLQLAVPALKQLTSQRFDEFSAMCQALVDLDGKLDLFEWCLLNWLQHCVGSQYDAELIHRRDKADQTASIQPLLLTLLAVCAGLSAADREESAWLAGLTSLGLTATTTKPAADLRQLKTELTVLIHSAPKVKQQIWHMLKAAVRADQQTNEQEQLLLQAWALLLELPVTD